MLFYKAQKRTNYWSKIRRKAPKVPDITCPAIDDVLNQLEKQIGRELKQSKFNSIERKLDKLRDANEKLRDSGKFWHDECEEAVRDLLGKKKSR